MRFSVNGRHKQREKDVFLNVTGLVWMYSSCCILYLFLAVVSDQIRSW